MSLVMGIMTIFPASGYFINDILAILSAVGCTLLFLSLFFPHHISARLISLGEWGTAPLVFGSFFQFSMIITGIARETESIGFLITLPTGVVTGLFAVSILLVVARWWLKKNGFASMPW